MTDLGFHKENIKFFEHFGISEESGIPAKKIALVLQNEYKGNSNAQQIYILCCNLLARLFLNIDFIVPNGTTLNGETNQLLNEYVLLKTQLIFPQGNFLCHTELTDMSKYDGILLVGCLVGNSPNVISVISNGWNVYINKDNIKSENYNPISACAASCMGASELFKLVVKPRGSKLCKEMSFSLLNYNTEIPAVNPELPTQIDIGEVTLVGAGAIGSAVIYTLKCLDNIIGKLDIIDGDRYSSSNLNRYIIADETTLNKYKVDVAKEILVKHLELNVIKHSKIYDDFKKENPRIDTLITSVDKKITRFYMQSDIPRLIIDAATTDSFIDLARVDFGTKGACLGCLYLPEPKDDLLYNYISKNTGLSLERVKYLYVRSEGVSTEDIKIISSQLGKDLMHCLGSPIESVYAHEYCGSSKVTSDIDTGEVVLAPVSFISALAGILITCELIKDRYYPEYKVKNHFLIDTFKLPNPKLHNFKVSNIKCPYCNDEVILDVYREKWA